MTKNAPDFEALKTADTLRAWIRRLNELAEISEDVIEEIAEEIRRDIIAQSRRQQSPSGRAWPRTKTGAPALRNVAKELDVRVVGDVILLRLDGVYARHSLGAVRGKRRRQILPTKQAPYTNWGSVRRVVERRFSEIFR